MSARNYGLGHWLADTGAVTCPKSRRTAERRVYRRRAFAFVVGLVAVFLFFAFNAPGV